MTVISKVNTTLATLKGCQGTLQVYATQTRDADTRQAYLDAIQDIKGVLDDIQNRVQAMELQEPQYKGN
jgi:hypothetical protein